MLPFEFIQRRTHPIFLVLLVGIILCNPKGAIPQTTSVQSPDSLRFEIVSIKPSTRTNSSTIRVLPNGFEAIGFPLGATLLLAYFPPPFYKHDSQLRGYPSWIFDDIYDIEARVSPADATQWQALNQDVFMFRPAVVLQSLLRKVLAERCGLRVHNVDSKSTGYALTVGKRKKTSITLDSSESHPSQGDVVPGGGFQSRSVEGGDEVRTFYQTTMPGFAEWLNLTSSYPIVDRTGLTAKYRFSIRHTPPEDSADPVQIVPWRLDEIGLKLVKEEITVKTLYIDQIQRPSPN